MSAVRFVVPPPGLEPLAAFEITAVAVADGLY